LLILYATAFGLLVLWVIGLLSATTFGGLIHVLLIGPVALLLVQLFLLLLDWLSRHEEVPDDY
jgi:hypothetical protein